MVAPPLHGLGEARADFLQHVGNHLADQGFHRVAHFGVQTAFEREQGAGGGGVGFELADVFGGFEQFCQAVAFERLFLHALEGGFGKQFAAAVEPVDGGELRRIQAAARAVAVFLLADAAPFVLVAVEKIQALFQPHFVGGKGGVGKRAVVGVAPEHQPPAAGLFELFESGSRHSKIDRNQKWFK